MHIEQEPDSEQAEPETSGTGNKASLLRSEVNFWRDLLGTAGNTEPQECIERMQQALALAELRLRELTAPPRSSQGNILHIHSHRRYRTP